MRLPRLPKNASGFTLMELIVVIAILGILATVILTVLNPLTQVKKAQDAGRKAALKQVQNALEQYYNDNGSYPSGTCTSDLTQANQCWSLGANSFLGSKASIYLLSLPKDPKQTSVGGCGANTFSYGYYSASGSNYILTTHLEIASDPSIQTGQSNAYTSTGAEPCTGDNYKVVSQQQ